MSKNETIKFGKLNKNELFKLVDLLNIVFPNQNSIKFEYLDWLYNSNPDGKAVTYNVWKNNNIVAHYAVVPTNLHLFGKKTNGLLSLNTAVHPDFKGKRYFTKLANLTYKKAKKLGFKFVIGVANAASTPIFINRLGFQNVGNLSVYIRNNYTKKSDLIDRKNFRFDLTNKYSVKKIKWRLSRPGADYKIKIGDTVKLFSPSNFMGLNVCIWEEELNSKLAMITKQKVETNYKNYFPFHIWIGLSAKVKKSGYFNLPKFLRPSPLNFIFKDLTIYRVKLSYDKLDISVLDFDAY